jgi:hypothetical protein
MDQSRRWAVGEPYGPVEARGDEANKELKRMGARCSKTRAKEAGATDAKC